MSKLTRSHILFGVDDASVRAGVHDIITALKTALAKSNLSEEIDVLQTGSLGVFGHGVCAVVYPEGFTYVDIKADDITELVAEQFLKGRPIKRLLLDASQTGNYDYSFEKRIVLEHSGHIDPENIKEYLGVGGYEAWEKALLSMNSDSIIKEVKDSGLRGRGGAGFPTGLKWSFTAPIDAPEKLFVINADEGEPGTFKDRLIMEGDPHKLLEGLMISSYAVGASQAYIYIRGEYKLCIDRLNIAINQAKEYGLIGTNIFDSGYSLDIEIMIGAGAYVCGEETALIESMEGNRGIPRSKPPFPGVKGAWQKPTVVNNVETIANIPTIINKGAAYFAAIGTAKSKGTKVYTILGDVAMPGLTEVPMGMPLRTIINKYAGGMRAVKKFKAAMIGGSAGVILSDSHLDVKMAYEHLGENKAVLGSGAILVMGDDVPMVEMLESIIHFFAHESCGKCRPCSLGTKMLSKLIRKVKIGNATSADLDYMISLATAMLETSFCALGQSLIMPVKSAIENFRSEFEARLK